MWKMNENENELGFLVGFPRLCEFSGGHFFCERNMKKYRFLGGSLLLF
jgi:hypothetical protein